MVSRGQEDEGEGRGYKPLMLMMEDLNGKHYKI